MLANGKLLTAAEAANFDLLLTVDKSVRHQQNISRRTISLITIDCPRSRLKDIAPLAPHVLELMVTLAPGSNVSIRPGGVN